MFDQLLFLTNGSDGANAVLSYIADMVVAHDTASHLLHAASPESERRPSLTGGSEGDGTGDDPSGCRRSDGERFVNDAATRASQSDATVVTSVEHGESYQVITEHTTEQGADLVVMPTYRRTGLSRLLLGSTTERIVRRLDVPMLTVRPDMAIDLAYPYADMLTSADGSACAIAAVTFGSESATATDAALHTVPVVNVAAFGADIRGLLLLDELEEWVSDAVDAASDTAAAASAETIKESVGHDVSIRDGVFTYINEYDVNIVVMGVHGHAGSDRYMLGSVAEELARSSSVLVVTAR